MSLLLLFKKKKRRKEKAGQIVSSTGYITNDPNVSRALRISAAAADGRAQQLCCLLPLISSAKGQSYIAGKRRGKGLRIYAKQRLGYQRDRLLLFRQEEKTRASINKAFDPFKSHLQQPPLLLYTPYRSNRRKRLEKEEPFVRAKWSLVVPTCCRSLLLLLPFSPVCHVSLRHAADRRAHKGPWWWRGGFLFREKIGRFLELGKMRRKCLATDTQDGKKRAPPITVRCLVAPSYSAFFRKPFLS